MQKQYKVKGICWENGLGRKKTSPKEKIDLLPLGWMVDRDPY
jgi:hypothetical protein